MIFIGVDKFHVILERNLINKVLRGKSKGPGNAINESKFPKDLVGVILLVEIFFLPMLL